MTLQAAAKSEPEVTQRKAYLFGPIVDFLMLGGSAFVLLPPLFFVPLRYEGVISAAMLLLANLINHPHFAHSYQIFYRNFGRKVRGEGYGKDLQVRYIFAGIIVPIIMVVFFAYAFGTGNTRLLGYASNAMAFFVGWHYVKQGYGMLMVDAVLKRKFFNDGDKKVLLINSYAVWILAWLEVNSVITRLELWGLNYYTFSAPSWIINVVITAAAASTAATIVMLINRWRKNGNTLPYNGVIAYSVSLYAWILLGTYNPLWLLVIPALHSTQYLAVVWRYQTNVERDQKDAGQGVELKILSPLSPRYKLRVAAFIIVGGIIGALGFWLVPMALNQLVPYNREVMGSTIFLFIFWVFINVHHYFLDNVMWRRGNPEVSRYLFK
ncbi:hypothetical protein FJ987_24230 [Mesorhizobium sp. CU2]|uniref:hypothetical protein n=1 Tax=unclassified Mesorhizobium TaxID=325217 RepID=UPI00112766C3|nr:MULTISPECIES: hypothetical protein [unclassified Mesorhizobium]TPN89349.1 hypothetical protein FJ988_00020 [Mesorhizobium sp. CU3]TPO07486.1 hypothetical protein FJ987_24230 [Mesorhizobium sp. CU2]